MSQLSRRESRVVHATLVEDEDVWRASAEASDAQRRRDEALRAEGRQQAWAFILILLGAGGLVTVGLRSPGGAVLALGLLVYGLSTAVRIRRVQ